MLTIWQDLISIPAVFQLLLIVISVAAGCLGSILGLGGGVVIVPALTLLFGIHIRYAVAASLVAVIATSSGAAAAYVRDRLTNIRVALLLEVGTVAGALSGAVFSGIVSARFLYILFSVVLVYSALMTFRNRKSEISLTPGHDKLSARLKLNSAYPSGPGGEMQSYWVQRAPLGVALMYVAGFISALLGIGSGSLKVPAMDMAMKLPFKVSSATSNFMIGVTGAASAGAYYMKGDVIPSIAAPVALGVFAGSWLGARLMKRISAASLRTLFMVVLFIIALQMMYKGVTA